MTIADLIYLHPLIALIIFFIIVGLIFGLTNKFTTEYKERQKAYIQIIELTLKVMNNAISAEEWSEKINILLLTYGLRKDYYALLHFRKKASESNDVNAFFLFINHFRKSLNLQTVNETDIAEGIFKKE